MVNFYRLSDHQLMASPANASAHVILAAKPTKAEQTTLCQTFDLEPLTFAFCNSPEEVSRFHKLSSTVLNDGLLLVLYDFISQHQTIERQLAPVIIIFDQSHLLICTENASDYLKELQNAATTTSSIYDLAFRCIKHSQERLLKALLSYKPEIDRLDAAARQTIENDELRALTNLTRKLVFFEHTMNDQNETLKKFLAAPQLSIVSHANLFNTQIRQQRLTKTIHIYRDLLESISSLFTAMMDNNLNHLMKYLDSAGLVIAVIALVTGFMGMNVGGLP